MSAQQEKICTGYEASTGYLFQTGDLWLLVYGKQSDQQYSEQPEMCKMQIQSKASTNNYFFY